MPRKAEYSREDLQHAALDVVRKEGWEQLSARTLAKALGCSTRPIYTAFASMQELRDAAAEAVMEMLISRMSQVSTGSAFVDMGVGYVDFAREEPALFRLFLLPQLVSAKAERAQAKMLMHALLAAMRGTTEFGPLAAAAQERILMRLKIFTHGLACYVVSGDPAFQDAVRIAQLVRDSGRAFYLDEVYGQPGGVPPV